MRCLLLCLVFLSCVPAQIRVQSVEGPPIEGRFAGFDPARGLTVLTAGGEVTIAPAVLISAGWNREPYSLPPGSAVLRFVNEDQLVARIDQGNFDEVRIGSAILGNLRLLLDPLRSVENLDFSRSLPAVRFARQAEPGQDELVLKTGDRLDRLGGELIRLERNGPVFTSAAGEDRLFPWSRAGVVAVHLAEPVPVEKPSGMLCEAEFVDGSVLTGALKAGAERLEMKLAVGPTVRFGVDSLRALRFESSSFAFLSDLDPAKVIETPWIKGSALVGWRKNSGFGVGSPARIGKLTYERALVARAKTTLTYELGGKAKSLRAMIGADPATADRVLPGSVRVRVLVDGKERFVSELLKAGAEPRSMVVDELAGAKRLSIVVDFGESGPTGAIGVLGDPLLLSE